MADNDNPYTAADILRQHYEAQRMRLTAEAEYQRVRNMTQEARQRLQQAAIRPMTPAEVEAYRRRQEERARPNLRMTPEVMRAFTSQMAQRAQERTTGNIMPGPISWGQTDPSLPNSDCNPGSVLRVLNEFDVDTRRIWCAGSAAIYPEKANDLDIFFLDDHVPRIPWTFQRPIHNLAYDGWTHRVLGNVRVRQWTVQMIVVPYDDIQHLLQSFDVSCHAHAVNQNGNFVSHPGATLPGDPIRLFRAGPVTQERYLRFAQRYYPDMVGRLAQTE